MSVWVKPLGLRVELELWRRLDEAGLTWAQLRRLAFLRWLYRNGRLAS